MNATYRLLRPALPVGIAPELDASQQRVVDHTDGPLLVLAGPGTGKTTTLVEAVVARVDSGISPDEVLVLTFGRRAADELRERIALRLGRTVAEPAAFTFHGFCSAVVRDYAVQLGVPSPRLLSGDERTGRIADLLAGNAAGEGTTKWPAEVAPAMELTGFAREVADLLDRARERGLDSIGLRDLGITHNRPLWVAAGEFMEEYLEVLDFREELDYAALVAAATNLLAGPRAELTRRYRAVYVDEYQDTDPAQEQLLKLLAGDGRLLVAVGDPDQSIYGFRGAEINNIIEFPLRFKRSDGMDAEIATLDTCRRMSAPLIEASREFARKIPLGRLHSKRDEHRNLASAGPDDDHPLQVRLFASGADEVIAIADVLRRAHLVSQLPWDEMAVLVRSGKRSIPALRRALVAAGIPVAVAADELPLASDPAVAPMIGALEILRQRQSGRLHNEVFTPDLARMLLLSPLGRGSNTTLRALGRRLRERRRVDGDLAPLSSAILIRDAILDPSGCDGLEDWVTDPVRRLAGLLDSAQVLAGSGAAPEEVLWLLWQDSGWAGSLTATAAGVGAAARAADRDLDSMVALFDVAARIEDRNPKAGINGLLDEVADQQFPAAPNSERAASPAAVRLLTAHRSKGLEWQLVVVCGVQDGVWPDTRMRGTLLETDLLAAATTAGAMLAPPSTAMLLAEERRLFYVAVTRAKRRLLVTAVSGVDDDSERPSRLLDELGVDVPETAEPAGGELLSAPSLVARLRRTLTAPLADNPLRAEAVERLAQLATVVGENAQSLLPFAHPSSWWGLLEPTTGVDPVRPAAEPVSLSGSAMWSFTECPRRWFLDREVKAGGVSTSSQGLGSLIHALAEAVATGELAADPVVLFDELEKAWPSLPFEAEWQRARDLEDSRQIIDRFLRWHHADDRELVGAEVEFLASVGNDVVIRGRADRLERDAEGRLVVVDLKTGKTVRNKAELVTDPQLGVYQVAVRNGGFDGIEPTAPGGAELIQLRQGANAVKVQPQVALPDEPIVWIDLMIDDVAGAIRSEAFDARPNSHCDHCKFRTSCPATDAGQEVIT